MKKLFCLIILTTVITMPAFLQAQNQLIPKPQEYKSLDGDFIFSQDIKFSSPDLKVNLKEYFKQYLKELYGFNFSNNEKDNSSSITLKIDKNFMNSNPEAYSLKIEPDKISIVSSNERGLFYGIQTIFQLLPKGNLNGKQPQIQCCEITDYPEFKWRGLNLDCARHFMTKDFVKRYIDILAYYKFNTLHWHLTDDQGWRIEIKRYPKLTQVGAWRKEADGSIYGGYYTQEDIKEVVAYAKSRFIKLFLKLKCPGIVQRLLLLIQKIHVLADRLKYQLPGEYSMIYIVPEEILLLFF